MRLQGFTTAAVLASLPAERFTYAYLDRVGITGLGLQQVLISVKAALQREICSGAILPSVYGALPAGQQGVKCARQDIDEEEEDE